MALNERAEKIYEIARIWLDECLFGNGSLFWPGRDVWTNENLNNFWKAFAENLDEGRGTFVEKWAQQIQDQSDDVHRMAVEVTAIYCLFPRNQQMGPNSKRALMQDVYAFRDTLGEMEKSRIDLFNRAIDDGGIGLTGAGYLAARPFHIGMYLGFAKAVKESGAQSIDDLDPKTILSQAFDLVTDTMKFRPVSTVHILLHLLWPERFEDYASADYKQTMAKNLSAHFGLPELDDIDETILQARRHMEANGYEKNFSMYDPVVEPLWRRSEKDPQPAKSEVSKKFELAALFKERVLENNRSFLWPNDETVWTPEHLAEARELIQPLAGLSYPEAFGKLVDAAQAAPRPVFQIVCDVRAASILARRLTPETAQRQMSMFFSATSPFDGDQQTFDAVIQSSADRAPGVPAYHNKMINQVITLLTGLSACIRNPDVLGDRDRMCEVFVATIPKEQEDFLHFPIWSFFYLMYPSQFASVPTWTDRQSVLRAFESITAGREFQYQMSQLAFIREQLDKNFDPYRFDFYASPWREKWVRGEAEGDSEVGDSEEDQTISAVRPPTITDLSKSTFLDEGHLEDIENLLRSKKQLIFEGPPGSGKTYVAEQFARYFTGQSLTSDKTNDQVELIQFHQSYSYEDFVEGIRPRMDGGQLVYHVEAGIFLRLVGRAAENPDKRYVLIIDEINRGNVSRILGELMLLLEYRDKSATLPYSKDPLQIPENLYIIGTMNTADRSLSQIDYALRRRFYFVRFMSVENGAAPVLDGWLARKNLEATTHASVLQMFIALNQQLETDLGTDDLQVGHSYFMDDNIHNERQQQHIWTYAVLPLIREYLYHHRERESLLDHYRWDRLTRMVTPTVEEQIPTESLETDAFNEFEQ